MAMNISRGRADRGAPGGSPSSSPADRWKRCRPSRFRPTAGWPLLAFIGVLCADASAAADENESHDEQIIQELFLGELPYPQEREEVQITLRGLYLPGDEADNAEISVAAEYGITERFQIALVIPFRHRDPSGGGDDDDDGDEAEDATQGIGDVEAEILYAFVIEDWVVAAAALGVGFPTGDEERELGEGKFEWEPSLRGGVRFGEIWLFGSLGAEIADDGEIAIAYGAAVAKSFSRGFSGVLELSGLTGAEKELLFLVPGLTWLSHTGVELQFGVPVGLSNEASDWGLVAAITVEF